MSQILQVEKDSGGQFNLGEATLSGAVGVRSVDIDVRELLEAIQVLIAGVRTFALDATSLAALESISATISNLPATQPVSGTVGVSNFPATQTVDGAVTVSNFPATQTVSGTVSVTGVATETTLDSLHDKVPNLVGTLGYRGDTLTSGSLSATGRVTALRVFATAADGTFNINGGDTLMVREDTGFDLNPDVQLVDPTVNWVSGTLDVSIWVLT